MNGVVLKSTGSWYLVSDDKFNTYTCRTRGKLRLKGFRTTNPISVGDLVDFDIDHSDEKQGIITKILPRKNYIIRKAIKKKSHSHIIAANVDQVMLIITLTYPRTSLGFIDRFLVSAEAFRIPQVLVFNKYDLLNDYLKQVQQEIINMYEHIGIQCIECSALEETGIEKISSVLHGKKTLISGHSGVGKSTIVNLLSPDINQTTSVVSDFAEKGVHTTTFAEMFRLEDDTFIIDTPGIKELGLVDMEDAELSDYFPEMRVLQTQCKFYNCTHVHEPKCAVIKAVEAGDIAESRYYNYLSMLEDEDNRR